MHWVVRLNPKRKRPKQRTGSFGIGCRMLASVPSVTNTDITRGAVPNSVRRCAKVSIQVEAVAAGTAMMKKKPSRKKLNSWAQRVSR